VTSRDVRRAIAASCMIGAIGCAMAPPGRQAPRYAQEATVRTADAPASEESKTAEPMALGSGVAPNATAAPTAPAGSPPVATKSPATAPMPQPTPPPPPVVTTDASKAEAPRSMARPTAAPASGEGDVLVSGGSGGGSTAGPTAPVAPPILQGPPAVQIAAAQANFDEAHRQLGSAGGDCAKLCKALASMQRATDRLCGLVAGSTDARRCTDARSKLTAATAKVNATCGSCGS
jgi:hypothetical protein